MNAGNGPSSCCRPAGSRRLKRYPQSCAALGSYTWQGSAGLQQEFRLGLGLTVSYFRTWYGNFTATDNLKVTPATYSLFCVTAPVDARLPGGGGNQICGQYDITPTAFGSVNNLVRPASDFGKWTEVYNGGDVSLSVRFGQGGVLNGGVATGRTVTNTCFVVDSPQQLYQCEVTNPSTQFKVNSAYPLPWDLQVSVVYQNLQGVPILANLVYTNAQIAPSLGRNLGSCGTRVPCNATATVSLIEPGTQFEDRYTQLDLRLTKTIRMGRARSAGDGRCVQRVRREQHHDPEQHVRAAVGAASRDSTRAVVQTRRPA